MATTVTPSEVRANYAHWIKGTGLSPTTKALYPRRVERFLQWLDAHWDEYQDALTEPHARDWAVRDFARELREVEKRAISTVEQYISAVTNLYDSHLQLGKPVVPRTTPHRGAPKGITTVQARRVLRVAERRGALEYAVTGVLMFCAVRVRECHALDIDDVVVTGNTGLLEVRRGKGDKPRRVPVPANARAALRPWIAQRNERYGTEPGQPLFYSRMNGRLSVRRMQSLMADLGEDAGVPLSPHMLRHTYAQTYLAEGGDVGSLQVVLGHKHLSSTQVYLEPNFDRISELAERVRIDL